LNVVSNPKTTTNEVEKKRAFETLTWQITNQRDNAVLSERLPSIKRGRRSVAWAAYAQEPTTKSDNSQFRD
jgi:hypothetical protein